MINSKKLSKLVVISIVAFIIFSVCYTSFCADTIEDQIADSLAKEITISNNTDVSIKSDNSNQIKNVYLHDDEVKIDYSVSGNAFIFAKKVTIDNSIDGNAFILADDVVITENAHIYRDAFIVSNKIDVRGYIYDLYCTTDILGVESSGYINRDLFCVSNIVNVNGSIERDANISCSQLNIQSSSKTIGGNLNYTSDKESTIPQTAVSGKINFTKLEKNSTNNLKVMAADLLGALLYSVIIILILVYLFKDYGDKSCLILKKNLPQTLLYGLLGLIGIPVLAIALLVTVIGIPASLVLIATYILALSLSNALVSLPIALSICNKIYKDNSKITPTRIIPISLFIILAIYLLSNIPYFGGLFLFVKIILALGILLKLIKDSLKKK